MKYKVITSWFIPHRKYIGQIGELKETIPSSLDREYDALVLCMPGEKWISFSRWELEEVVEAENEAGQG